MTTIYTKIIGLQNRKTILLQTHTSNSPRPIAFTINMHQLIIAAATFPKVKYARKKKSKKGRKLRYRKRKSIVQVYNELGRDVFRRSFRMHFEVFLKLFNKIKIDLYTVINYKPNCRRGPNGRIHPTVFLACALRVFSGGDPLDLITSFGVSKCVIHNSVDIIIETVCRCKSLEIKFPTCHEEQLLIAKGFEAKSRAGFKNCVGAIDGMLVWIHKPTEAECKKLGVGSAKFFCGRKKKFGLNLQATCDSKNKFLNISIKYPGSCSDFVAFDTSDFRRRLDGVGFLHPSLYLFGDNAYVNSRYMATPYANVSRGTKDSYNFYHSRLRINIECSFGILVQRWGILRCAAPRGFSINKVCKMVQCLCSLHNFLIDEYYEKVVPEYTAGDNFFLEVQGVSDTALFRSTFFLFRSFLQYFS